MTMVKMLETQISNLQNQIHEIQRSCIHEYEITGGVAGQKSLHPDVLLVHVFDGDCRKCSLHSTFRSNSICCNCLSVMRKAEILPPASERYTSRRGIPAWQNGGEVLYECQYCGTKTAERIILSYDK